MKISSEQNYIYNLQENKTNTNNVDNSEFESYLTKESKVENSDYEVTNTKNSENDVVKIVHIVGLDENGNPVYYPKEIEEQFDALQEKFLETKDAKYIFMQTELSLQYKSYLNGDPIDSMFVVGDNGKFRWSDDAVNSKANKNVDVQDFLNKMIEIFTQKQNSASGDLKDKYNDLLDLYTGFNEERNNSSSNETSYYA